MKGWDVAGIVTINISGNDSFMFQLPATAIAALQAKSAKIPWLPITVSGNPDNEMQELESQLKPLIVGSMQPNSSSIWNQTELNNLWPNNWDLPEGVLRLSPNLPIDALVTGALRSDYQKTRIERMAESLAVKSYTPLWHHDPNQHMHDLVSHGFELLFTSVSADGLDEQWVGRTLCMQSLEELTQLSKKHRFSIDGEGGEFETTVLSAPWMGPKINLQGNSIWAKQSGIFAINHAALE
jgi:diphthamide synthase (EF-2-diphthine--ammonia ligase)